MLQAEKEVAVRKPLAYPLAHLALILDQSCQGQFLPILTGRLMKRCPYMIPKYVSKLSNDTTADFRKRAGYRLVGDQLEKEAAFAERMSGIIALFAAICHHDKKSHLWTWLARFVNEKPRTVSPLLVFTFLEVAGATFVRLYQGQARKLIRFLLSTWIALAPPGAVAHSTRLTLFLQEFEQTGQIKPMEMQTLDP